MRSFVIALAIFGYALAGPAVDYELEGRALEDTVNKTLECVRDVLNKGVPDKGLPSCNPLDIKDLTVNLDNLNLTDYVSGKVNAKNVHVEGITTWHTRKLTGKLGVIPPSYTLDAEIWIERIHGQGDYDGKIKLINKHEIFGKGHIQADVRQIKANVHLKAKINNNKISLDELSLVIEVGSVQAKVTGLMNDDKVSQQVSDFLTNDLPKFLKDNPKWIDENITPILLKAFNDAAGNGAKPGGIIEAVLEKCSPL